MIKHGERWGARSLLHGDVTEKQFGTWLRAQPPPRRTAGAKVRYGCATAAEIKRRRFETGGEVTHNEIAKSGAEISGSFKVDPVDSHT